MSIKKPNFGKNKSLLKEKNSTEKSYQAETRIFGSNYFSHYFGNVTAGA